MKFEKETLAAALMLAAVLLMANLEPDDPVFSYFQSKTNHFETTLKKL